MNRVRFLIVENLPQNGGRIDTDVLIDDVVNDLSSLGSLLDSEAVKATLCDLNERQYVVVFNDGTTALTQYGLRMLG